MATSGDTDRERASGVRDGTRSDRAGGGGDKGGGGDDRESRIASKSVSTPKGTQKTSGSGMATSANKASPAGSDGKSSAPTTHGKPATGFDKFGMGSAAGMIESGIASADDVGKLARADLSEQQGAALRGQVKDAQDDGFGGLLGVLGLSERIDPDTVLKGNPNASWGFDPAGLIGGAIGLATGLPFVGTAAALASKAAGNPLEVNLGPDVLGGGAGNANLAGAGSEGRGSGLLADAGGMPPAGSPGPSPNPSPSPSPGPAPGSGLMAGLLGEGDTAYLRGFASRPRPAQRFQPGVYTGRLVYDPVQGDYVAAP